MQWLFRGNSRKKNQLVERVAILTTVVASLFFIIHKVRKHKHRVIYASSAGALFLALGSASMSVHFGPSQGSALRMATSCIDGTPAGGCVADRTGNQNDRPVRCVNGILTDDSANCGCPNGKSPWVDGTCTHYPHIKLYNEGVPYCTWTNPSSSDYTSWCLGDLQWAADHFDVTGSYTHTKLPMRTQNPGLKLVTGTRGIDYITTSEVSTGIPNFCATNGCADMESIYVHMKEDTQQNIRFSSPVCIPGYNPLNPPPVGDTQTCSVSASDHYARASSIAASRMEDGWSLGWKKANFKSNDWFNYFKTSISNNLGAGGTESDMMFVDNADFKPMNSQMEYTAEYFGIPTDIANAANHPRVQEDFDRLAQLRTEVGMALGKEKDLVVNVRDTASYIYYPWILSRYDALNALKFIQVWDTYEDQSNLPSGGLGRAHTNTDWLRAVELLRKSTQENQRYVLSGYNYGNDTNLDRSRTFLLSQFYLLNNKNMMFAYYNPMTEFPGPGFPGTNTARIQQYAWAPQVEYNIGVPTTNPAGKVDVFGQTNTAMPYLFAQGNDPSTPNNNDAGNPAEPDCNTLGVRQYYVYARHYTKAMVLTKFRDYCGKTDSTSATTHTLPGQYRVLQPDGVTLGATTTTVTLRNQEGVILIPISALTGCTENWSCSNWTTCTNGQQSRTCTDANSCGTTTTRPPLTQTCGTPPTCTESWSCDGWSQCSNGQQSRTCTDANSCGTTTTRPPLTQTCTACVESWTCGAWSSCVNNLQVRTCSDDNSCGTINNRPPISQSCTPVCSPNWSCGNWSQCTNSQQTRTCSDTNNCGISTGMPPLSQSCTCTESWNCGAWTTCSNGQQSRTCTDANSCGTTINQPTLTQSCTSVCSPNWSCTNWSGCQNNQQTRTCTDSNNCGLTSGKPSEAQTCSQDVQPLPPPNACREVWTCEQWSNCINNKTTRICTDKNRCGTTFYMPPISQSCVSDVPICVPNYLCSEWSACSTSGKRFRTCQDTNACPAEVRVKEETEDCAPVLSSTPDTSAPETTASVGNITQYSSALNITLSGTDDQTAKEHLRFYYQLDTHDRQLLKGQTLQLRRLANGNHKVQIIAVDEAGNEDSSPLEIAVTVRAVNRIMTVPRAGGPSLVRLFDYQGRLLRQFDAFPSRNRWGGSATFIDINGDGNGQILVAPAIGGQPEVRMFTPEAKLFGSFLAFDARFRGGINIAAADLTGDNKGEIIVAPMSGTSPVVKVFGPNGKLITQRIIFDGAYTGGVNLATGYLDGSDQASIVATAAKRGKAEAVILKLVNGNLEIVKRIKIPNITDDVGVAASVANIDAQGQPEIIATPTEGSRFPEVSMYSPEMGRVAGLLGAAPSYRGGLTIASGDLYSFDNYPEIVAATYSGSRSKVTIFGVGSNIKAAKVLKSFYPYEFNTYGLQVSVGSLGNK